MGRIERRAEAIQCQGDVLPSTSGNSGKLLGHGKSAQARGEMEIVQTAAEVGRRVSAEGPGGPGSSPRMERPRYLDGRQGVGRNRIAACLARDECPAPFPLAASLPGSVSIQASARIDGR